MGGQCGHEHLPEHVGDFQSHCPSLSLGSSHHARAPTLARCSLSRSVRVPAGRCEIRAVRSGETGQFPCADNPRRSEKFLHFSQFYTVNRFYSVADTDSPPVGKTCCQVANLAARRLGSYSVCVLSMTMSTARRRSATPRSARPWLCPRARRPSECCRVAGS